MAGARKLANMSPEDIEANVGKLTPVWAKDYIRQLEGLTRVLDAQLKAAQKNDGGLTQRSLIAMAGEDQAAGLPDPVSRLPGRDIDTALYALAQMWQAGYLDIGLSAEEMDVIDRVHALWFGDGSTGGPAVPARSGRPESPAPGGNPGSGGPQPSAWTLAGITPPGTGYAVVRVLEPAGGQLEPLADLPDNAVILFADAFQASYGKSPDGDGTRALRIEGDLSIQAGGRGVIYITRTGTRQ